MADFCTDCIGCVGAAVELGVDATHFFNKDALRLRMSLFHQPGLRQRLLNGEYTVEWDKDKKQ